MSLHPAIVVVGNASTLAVIVATAQGLLPALAALLAVIWYVLEILEHRRQHRKRRAPKRKRDSHGRFKRNEPPGV